ncbi:DNA methylase [Bacillus cereus]|nr:DNA methylase [Bacillus cereus]
MALKPFEWKDRPALIEHLFPVQKISAESYKEQMAGAGKTLTALGSYWKGRKPLILNKACILGSLLPTTGDHLKDLEIFELLLGMDSDSMRKRIAANLPASKQGTVGEYLTLPFNDQVRTAKRSEEVGDTLFSHIWSKVNKHLGTSATSFPELVEQMGVARFGRRPKLADVFSGSGQIPFEAARLGCEVYASDLNPIACMLTWGGFNIVGASKEKRAEIDNTQKKLADQIQKEIDELGVETDGNGWRAKAYLYCVEVKCPESGWMVPLLPNLIVNKTRKIILRLHADEVNKRYVIEVAETTSTEELAYCQNGTVQGGELVHSPDGITTYRVNIKTIRGDYKEGRESKNRLRLWEKTDFMPRPDDIFQERLYCIQWMKKKPKGSLYDYELRSVTDDDLEREQKVINYIYEHLEEWQKKGYIPDMVIEAGDKTDEPIRTRGWTHWHHLFNPRQLHILGTINKYISDYAEFTVMFPAMLNLQSKLCAWHNDGRKGGLQNVFSNQALNTLYNYGSRGLLDLIHYLNKSNDSENKMVYPTKVITSPAQDLEIENDIYVTDPPYGDAVKYEEITEYFIAWLRKNPPKEFANWTWDSRRAVAIKGEDEGFRQGMVAAYRKTTQKMSDNGIQVLMFTHQSGTIWADMANIIWASGLQVTAAWYVVTETDSALRQGANVKGTIILILRKRHQELETFRDDLGWEIEEAVKEQVESLIGLDIKVRGQGSEGLYTDADLQMAGYAAALKVLTAYSQIDGKDMVTEAEAPRQKGKKTFVDELIEFAVQTAVQFLVPVGFEKGEWQKLQAAERFYLKMAEMEHQGAKTLDNYQNFAKAFKVYHFDQLMSDSSKANSARLKLSTEFKSAMMSGDAEIAGTPLRALLYAFFELSKEVEVDDVLLHLMENCPNYLSNKNLLAKMADYLAEKREGIKGSKTFKPDVEASRARILAESIRNQRL